MSSISRDPVNSLPAAMIHVTMFITDARYQNTETITRLTLKTAKSIYGTCYHIVTHTEHAEGMEHSDWYVDT